MHPWFRSAAAVRALGSLTLGVLLYAAIAPAANAQGLDGAGREALRSLAIGEMGRLVVHDAPRPRIEATFHDADGAQTDLSAFAGRIVAVNFWATWCPPCRAEMPSLDRLAAELGTEDFAVVALSTDFGDSAKPAKFLAEIGAQHLPLYHDRKREAAREAAILGLPVTLLLDREGREVARVTGDAHWDRPEAVALMRALAALTSGAGG